MGVFTLRMNVISFSLYGTHPKYLHGMVKNIELARQFYPGWNIRIYCDEHCFKMMTPASPTFDHGVFSYTSSGVFLSCCGLDWCPPMLQRYLIADDPKVDRFIVRDADSRISQREVDAVNAWIESDKICHVMRDHPAHQLMPGGMIGIQPRRPNWTMPSMKWLIEYYLKNTNPPDLKAYQLDQDFLGKVLWPMFKNSMIQHDACLGRRNELGALPWPTPRTDWPRFVGEVWNINEDGTETPRDGDWQQIPVDE